MLLVHAVCCVVVFFIEQRNGTIGTLLTVGAGGAWLPVIRGCRVTGAGGAAGALGTQIATLCRRCHRSRHCRQIPVIRTCWCRPDRHFRRRRRLRLEQKCWCLILCWSGWRW